jgi:hypothetical protein
MREAYSLSHFANRNPFHHSKTLEDEMGSQRLIIGVDVGGIYSTLS